MHYRDIYKKYYGEIPIDENGITFDIHHIDGNKKNNDISNLIAVSVKEHYEIHKSQGNWLACLIMSSRLDLTLEEKLKINKNMAECLKGRKLSIEHRKKLSLITKGKKKSPEFIQKITGKGNGMYGKKHKKQTLEIFKIINKGEKNPFYNKPHPKRKKVMFLENNQIFDSITIAANYFKVTRKTIRDWNNKNYKIKII
jgi:hypothetical protein